MDWIRAIGVALAVYFVAFFVTTGSMRMGAAPQTTWFLTIGVAWLTMAIGSYWYFKTSKSRANMVHGALIGVTQLVLGFFLDLFVMMPIMMPGMSQTIALVSFYSQPIFIIGALFMVGIPAVIGLMMAKGR
jgi:hypothetical protein